MKNNRRKATGQRKQRVQPWEKARSETSEEGTPLWLAYRDLPAGLPGTLISVHPRSKIGTHTHTFGPTRVYFGQTAPTVLSLDDSDLRNPGTHVTKHGQTQKKAMFKACSGKKGRLRP